jgi:hypothetical protein
MVLMHHNMESLRDEVQNAGLEESNRERPVLDQLLNDAGELEERTKWVCVKKS